MTTAIGIPHDSILVTGAGGFIGSHVVEALLATGIRVTGLDNFCDSRVPPRQQENLQHVAVHPECTMITGDVRDAAILRKIFRTAKPTAVIHLAAMAGVRSSIACPAEYASVNVEGTATVLQASVEANCRAVLFASSSSVYGEGSMRPFAEDELVGQPLNPYAATKLAGELLCRTWNHLYGLPITCLRFFTVYGPRQRPDLVISRFMRCALEHRPAQMYGDGTSSRDYTFVEDIVEGVLAALQNKHGFHIFNLGSDRPTSLLKLIEALRRATGRDLHVKREATQPGDAQHTWADLTRSKAALGYHPRTTLDEGLRRQWQWMTDGND